MIKKVLITSLFAGVVVGGIGLVMFVTNPPPEVRLLATRDAGKPYVVKLHARWCPVCALTKSVWSEIDKAYAASVNLVVLDFTNGRSTAASRSEAKRIGLDSFFEEYVGRTGAIAVLDGHTKQVLAVIEGSRDFAEYRAAIDEVLKGPTRR